METKEYELLEFIDSPGGGNINKLRSHKIIVEKMLQNHSRAQYILQIHKLVVSESLIILNLD